MRLALLAPIVLACLISGSSALPVHAQLQPGHHPVGANGELRPQIDPSPDASRGRANGETGEIEAAQIGSETLVSGSATDRQRWHTTIEILLSIGVLAFGALVLWMLGALLRSGHITGGAFLKLFVLGVVVTSGLFVVVAGYTQDQIAPMMGLLGTLVGYLLGREGNAAPKAREGD